MTYKLTKDKIYISFDESLLKKEIVLDKISNRIIDIDLNPNYIGWSIVDWISEDEFKIVKSGVISFKELNDEKLLKGCSSNSKKRKHLNNKRKFESLEVCKNLIAKALYFKVEAFVIEDLNIAPRDAQKGKTFNRNVNNKWLRNVIVNNLMKRCNIFGIKFQKVLPQYSSFVRNFLFRKLNLPDPVLSSIEISRRGYEFINQFIKKAKERKKNIIQPVINKLNFKALFLDAMEEFKIQGEFRDLIELYYFFKKSKIMYRLSVSNFEKQFSRLFSQRSLVKKIEFDSCFIMNRIKHYE